MRFQGNSMRVLMGVAQTLFLLGLHQEEVLVVPEEISKVLEGSSVVLERGS